MYLQQKDVSKYHVQLSFALLMLVVALNCACGCQLRGVHYFTLVAVMWMGAESLLIHQKVVNLH